MLNNKQDFSQLFISYNNIQLNELLRDTNQLL